MVRVNRGHTGRRAGPATALQAAACPGRAFEPETRRFGAAVVTTCERRGISGRPSGGIGGREPVGRAGLRSPRNQTRPSRGWRRMVTRSNSDPPDGPSRTQPIGCETGGPGPGRTGRWPWASDHGSWEPDETLEFRAGTSWRGPGVYLIMHTGEGVGAVRPAPGAPWNRNSRGPIGPAQADAIHPPARPSRRPPWHGPRPRAGQRPARHAVASWGLRRRRLRTAAGVRSRRAAGRPPLPLAGAARPHPRGRRGGLAVGRVGRVACLTIPRE